MSIIFTTFQKVIFKDYAIRDLNFLLKIEMILPNKKFRRLKKLSQNNLHRKMEYYFRKVSSMDLDVVALKIVPANKNGILEY